VWAALAAIAAVLVVVILLGGLDRAEAAPEQLVAGETAELSLYSIAVLDAELTDEIEDQYLTADPGEVLVALTVRLENLSDRPISANGSVDRVQSRLVNSSQSLLELVDATPIGSVYAWREDGSSGGVVLQPDVPAQVRIAWRVPEDSFADGVVRLDVHDATARSGRVIISSSAVTWYRSELAAQIRVAVDG